MPCSCPLVHKDFRKFSNREPRAPKKSLHYSGSPQRHLPDPVRPAIPCLLPSKGTDFHAARVQSFGQGNHSGFRQALPSSYRPSGKSFWKGGARGGRTFFQKGFPLRKLFFLQISRRLPGVSQTKNPRRSGDKKRPPRAESCKGVSNNLWQRPTFPHDVMQYHRRWRA